MNCVRVNEATGAQEYVYCPVCFGELLLGAMLPDGSILEPEEGKVAVHPLPDGADPVVLCRDCDFRQVMDRENVYVFEGPRVPDPYAP